MDLSQDPASPAQAALAQFEANQGDAGRLAHYAKGRMAAFWLRQTLTLIGSLTIGYLESAWLGLTLILLALAGEGVEIGLLRLVRRQLALGRSGKAPFRLALLAAGIQALTIAACVALTWLQIPTHQANFFAMAFLISAMINAGLVRHLFPAAADLRLGIFFVTGIYALAIDYGTIAYSASRDYVYEVASFGLFCYISILFIALVERSQKQRKRHELALLRQQVAQEAATAELARAVEENRRLALVAEFATDSIIIGDPSGRIIWVNEAFSRVTGYSFHEAVGKHPGDLLNAPGTDPGTIDKILDARRRNVPVRFEILNRTKAGNDIWIDASINPVFEEDGLPRQWIAVERDISRAKEREEELARARIAAEEAGQSKSRFLANMSHEIRTPMNGVIGVAELLSETRLTPVQADYVETIMESGRALLALINDILDLAKLQSGKATLDQLPFAPQSCIDSALRVLGPAAAKKGIDLRFERPEEQGYVLGDEGKLRQVVLNLVGNAIKFTQDGAVTVRLRLPRAEGDWMEIEVEDTGIGIAPDRLDAIFESFSQADVGIGRQFGGTGLGLTICARLAEQMAGDIRVRSQPGQGSVFTFRARLPGTATPESAPARTERRREPRLRPGLRILVAEDNRTNLMIVRKMLAGSVGTLAEAQNGAEAVALYREMRPDLILMDVSMPVKDGLQATREIRALEAEAGLPRCPIIALTANVFDEDRDTCDQAGMDGFLTKPLSRLDLLSAIAGFCPAPAKGADVIGL